MDKIDKFVIINLAHRKDRLAEIKFQLEKVKIAAEKIYIFPAIYEPTFGALGCTKSHIGVLQYFEDNQALSNICILEDDFDFKVTREELDGKLNILFQNFPDWDIVNLSSNASRSVASEIPFIHRPIIMGTTSGYLVRRKALNLLKNNYQESCQGLMTKGLQHEHCLDVHWYKLFKILNWYLFKPSLGFQRASFSDVNQNFADYKV